MNRLQRLRDVPDEAWDASPSRRHRPLVPPRGPSPFLLLPFRVLRAAMNDPQRFWLMVRMALVYGVVSFRARVEALPKAFASISPPLSARPIDEAVVPQILGALDSLLTAGVPLIRPQCWRRAAVLHRFLRLKGIDTTIVFGVTTDAVAGLEAHAWLERDGKPFAEVAPPTRYRRVFEFPALRGPIPPVTPS